MKPSQIFPLLAGLTFALGASAAEPAAVPKRSQTDGTNAPVSPAFQGKLPEPSSPEQISPPGAIAQPVQTLPPQAATTNGDNNLRLNFSIESL